jgi:hypothetical protein
MKEEENCAIIPGSDRFWAREVVQERLERLGCSGLVNPRLMCDCRVDDMSLMSCESCERTCIPAWECYATEEDHCTDCHTWRRNDDPPILCHRKLEARAKMTRLSHDQYERCIKKLCELLLSHTGTCPVDLGLTNDDCADVCSPEVDHLECWIHYAKTLCDKEDGGPGIETQEDEPQDDRSTGVDQGTCGISPAMVLESYGKDLSLRIKHYVHTEYSVDDNGENGEFSLGIYPVEYDTFLLQSQFRAGSLEELIDEVEHYVG